MSKKIKAVSLLLCFVMLLGLLGACGGNNDTPQDSAAPTATLAADAGNEDKADIVMKNGTIQTMVSEDDVAQAIAIKGNTIVYVGDDAGA